MRLSIPWPKNSKSNTSHEWNCSLGSLLPEGTKHRSQIQTHNENEFPKLWVWDWDRGDRRWEDCRDEETKLLRGLTQRAKGHVLKNAVFWVHLKTIKRHNNARGSMDLKGWSTPVFKWILKRTDKGRFAVEQRVAEDSKDSKQLWLREADEDPTSHPSLQVCCP